MIRAIRAINVSQRYISPEIARALALRHLDIASKSPVECCLSRKLQVFIMITQGAQSTRYCL